MGIDRAFGCKVAFKHLEMGDGEFRDKAIPVVVDQLKEGVEIEGFFISCHGNMGFEFAVFFGDARFFQGIFEAVEENSPPASPGSSLPGYRFFPCPPRRCSYPVLSRISRIPGISG